VKLHVFTRTSERTGLYSYSGRPEVYHRVQFYQTFKSSIFSGLNIAQSNFGAFQAVASIFVFSISSPIGIGIGMVLVNMEKSLAGDIANGILQVRYKIILKKIIIISG
jgi:hypothetical protein